MSAAPLIGSDGDAVMLRHRAGPTGGRKGRSSWAEIALAIIVFAAMCVLVLTIAPQTAEPDDGAYRASIVAITEGHFLSLSERQAAALAASLNDNPDAPPNQWVELPNGRYISEKDPGYPFLAAPFDAVGLIRWAPLFYTMLACLGLFVGARRWLGSFGGVAAVGLYCSSGAALAFAWRDFMPTFTGASLIAAGFGALLWTVLETDAANTRRAWVGLAGFIALEAATFVRYTDIVLLVCACVAVAAAWRVEAARLDGRTLCLWLGSALAFAAGLGLFNDLVYGGPLRSGYQPGEITFALGAVGANVRLMPRPLLQAMPMLVLGLIAMAWISAAWLRHRHGTPQQRGIARRDLAIGAALAGSWFAIWALYSTYTWTIDPTNAGVSDVRFYVPAIGCIALLGAWLVTRIPNRSRRAAVASAVIVASFAFADQAFHAMYAALDIHLHG